MQCIASQAVIGNKTCDISIFKCKAQYADLQSCNFKKKSKFMKQNSYQSKQNSTQNSFKKQKKFINCPTGPNLPKSQILFDKKSPPPQEFISRTLRIGTYLGKQTGSDNMKKEKKAAMKVPYENTFFVPSSR